MPKSTAAIVLFVAGFLANSVNAAILTGSLQSSFFSAGGSGVGGQAGTLDLTSLGILDWRQFAENEQKAGGDILSDYSISDSPQTYANELYGTSWSDGTPTAAGSVTTGLAIEGTSPFFTFTSDASDTQMRRLTVIVGGFHSTNTITVSLPNAPDFSEQFGKSDEEDNFSLVYVFDYLADDSLDKLSVTYTMDSGTEAHLVAAAVSASPTAVTPEPASLAIWGGISIAGLFAWRRKRALVAKFLAS